MFSHSVLNAFSQTELRESDSVRINLRRCSGAAATSLSQWLTEPVTFGWVWDYWCFICAVVAHLRLLRLSYVKMRDCQTKPQGCDNNLSVSWLSPATPSLFLLQSFCLSSPPLWLLILTFCLPVTISLPFHPFLVHLPFLTTLFPPPSLICLSPFHHIYASYFFLFGLAHNSDADVQKVRPYGQLRGKEISKSG